ncbi:g9778 [Coccomyxa elongata]
MDAHGHGRYIDEVATFPRPERLGSLLKVLEAQRQTIVPPSNRDGLQPLLIPLACHQSPAGPDEEVYTCFLRWPDLSSSRGMPIVQTSKGSRQVQLLARSTDEYIHRALCEEDAAECTDSLASAAGEGGREIYQKGAFGSSGLGSVDAYLVRKAGMYPDVVERLAMNHIQKGDKMSALITAEWYTRKNHFPGWARPFEFNANLYSSIGRNEEARDGARIALRFPWWTLSGNFQDTASLAQLPGDATAVQQALDMQSSINKEGIPPGVAATRSPNQVAMDDADMLLNRVAAGEGDWDSIRQPLAEKYREAGLSAVADFVLA